MSISESARDVKPVAPAIEEEKPELVVSFTMPARVSRITLNWVREIVARLEKHGVTDATIEDVLGILIEDGRIQMEWLEHQKSFDFAAYLAVKINKA